MGRERRIITNSEDETRAFGRELVLLFPQGALFCFRGDLGAGKTTLIKGIVEAASSLDPCHVTSPTFTYLNIYPGVCHFDLYRLASSKEFVALGLEEYLHAPGYVCIEWSERIIDLLPSEVITLSLRSLDASKREILCTSTATIQST